MSNGLGLSGSSYYILSAIVVVLLLVSQTHGLDISYCSPENNAGSFPTYNYPYQSNGECQQHCQGSYAFAVLQGNDCWCSNYIPANQVSTSDCNQPCPGYPSEWCGSTDEGLYGYFILSPNNPSGTLGGSSATVSQTTSVSIFSPGSGSSSLAPTITITTVQTISPSTPPTVVTVWRSQSSEETSSTSSSRVTSSTSSRSTSRSSSTSGSTTGSATSSNQQTEVYTSVTTVTGEVRTVVITPSPTATSDANLGQPSAGGGGSNVGKVVGIVLGVVLGVIAVIAFAIWLWLRRRRQNNSDSSRPESTFMARTGDSSSSNNVPSRQVSQMSSAGLLGNKAPRINTFGMPAGSDPRSADTTSSGFDRRSVGTDQRLNPYALYIHDEGRVSDVSLQDNQDYSRQLRVANPDA